MSQLPLLTALLLFIAANAAPLPVRGAELELSETLQLPECHGLGWVRVRTGVKCQSAANSRTTASAHPPRSEKNTS